MKKKEIVAIMAVVLLSWCGAKVSNTNNEGMIEADAETTEVVDEETQKANYLANAEYGDIVDPNWEGSPLAPQAIIKDYLSGDHKYIGQYYQMADDGWIRAEAYLGDEHVSSRRYYPRAFCDTDYTADELIEGYADQTLPWKYVQNIDCAFLSSSDYRNCFEIRDDWLLMNDIRLCPVGQMCMSVEPASVLDEYQHGFWDGETPLYSSDYSTMVYLDYDGTLEYYYEAVQYAESYDPMRVAYRRYVDPPIFLVSDINDIFQAITVDDRWYGTEADSPVQGHQVNVRVKTYVDLPNGTTDSLENLISLQYAGPEIGMYVISTDGVELYRRGVLMNAWECEVSTSTPHLDCFGTMEYVNSKAFDGENHLWVSDEKIVRLLPNGDVETVLDNIVDTYGIGEYALLDLSLQDGKLVGYNSMYGLVDIAENIVSVDHAWNIAIITDEDGVCYAFDEDDYEAMEQRARTTESLIENTLTLHRLGEEPSEWYLELHRAGLLEYSDKVVENF